MYMDNPIRILIFQFTNNYIVDIYKQISFSVLTTSRLQNEKKINKYIIVHKTQHKKPKNKDAF